MSDVRLSESKIVDFKTEDAAECYALKRRPRKGLREFFTVLQRSVASSLNYCIDLGQKSTRHLHVFSLRTCKFLCDKQIR